MAATLWQLFLNYPGICCSNFIFPTDQFNFKIMTNLIIIDVIKTAITFVLFLYDIYLCPDLNVMSCCSRFWHFHLIKLNLIPQCYIIILCDISIKHEFIWPFNWVILYCLSHGWPLSQSWMTIVSVMDDWFIHLVSHQTLVYYGIPVFVMIMAKLYPMVQPWYDPDMV